MSWPLKNEHKELILTLASLLTMMAAGLKPTPERCMEIDAAAYLVIDLVNVIRREGSGN